MTKRDVMDEAVQDWRFSLLAMLFFIAGGMAIFCAVGCRQMPVLRGPYQEDKVAQAKVDSQQSDRIADVAAVGDGTLVALEEIAPESKVVPVVHQKAKEVRGKADIDAAKARDRADREERVLESVNAAPGPLDFIGRAMAGDWMGLMDMLLGLMGVGGAAYGVRSRMKSRQVVEEVVDGVERYKEESKDGAQKLQACLSRSMDRRTKDIIKKVRSKR